MIRKNINKGLLLLLLLLCTRLPAQVVSPFNKLEIKEPAAAYSFIVSGHFHGSSGNASTFPAATLLANIDTLNSLDASFIMSLGDLFLDVNENYVSHYRKSLFDKLKLPLFNSVGNHDLSNGNLYGKLYGKTYFAFTLQSERYIVLNTEQDNGDIKNEQLAMLKEQLTGIDPQKIKNVFIFSHRPLWAESIKRYTALFEGNTRSVITSNFDKEIRPLLRSIPATVNTCWFSGSMGGTAPASFFYDKDPETNVTFMQTGIRDLPRDAVLLVTVKNGALSFKGISFTGQQLESLQSYNMAYWSKTVAPEQKFNYRLLPYLILQMLLHPYFWIGAAAACLLIVIFSLLRKRWKRRK